MSPIKLTLGRALRFWVWVRFVAVIVRLPCRWLTRRRLTAPRPFGANAGAGQGDAVCVCRWMELPVSRRAGGALPPRLFASLSAPPGEGLRAPTPGPLPAAS